MLKYKFHTSICQTSELIKTCDIWPCSGIAVNPRLRSINATRWVFAHVSQKTMKELPASSFSK